MRVVAQAERQVKERKRETAKNTLRGLPRRLFTIRGPPWLEILPRKKITTTTYAPRTMTQPPSALTFSTLRASKSRCFVLRYSRPALAVSFVIETHGYSDLASAVAFWCWHWRFGGGAELKPRPGWKSPLSAITSLAVTPNCTAQYKAPT